MTLTVKAMKSLRILHTESSTGLGGQEFRIVSEAVGMVGRGHVVVLAVPPKSRLQELAGGRGLLVEPVSLRKSRYLPLVVDFLGIIKRHSIQIITTHGSLDSWTASIAGRLSKRNPIIIRARHKSTPISRNFHHRILYRWLPHAIITTGETVRREIVLRQGIDPSRIISIPTGVDIGIFKPADSDATLRAEFGILPHQFLVGTVAFLRDYKGLDYFLDAAWLVTRKHPETRFLIVGDGPEQSALRTKIKALGLSASVTLAGYREDIPKILAAMDAFVLSSVDAEGVPQALTQAMAMERPVIATDVGSIREVLTDQVNGLLVPPKDPQALSFCLNRLIQDKALREAIAKKGRGQIVDAYSLDVMLNKTEGFYQELLDSFQPSIRPEAVGR